MGCPNDKITWGKKSWDPLEAKYISLTFFTLLSFPVGAVIVNDQKRIVGIGYNGMPRGCSDDKFPWGKTSQDPLETKYMYVCHAEMNAILNKNSANVEQCDIYVALFPCNECAKMIIQSGIKASRAGILTTCRTVVCLTW